MGITLVDTDIMIDLAADASDAKRSLQVLEDTTTLAVSVITEMELFIGCRNKTELRNTEQFLGRFQVVPLNQQISDKASQLIRKYRLSHGLLIPDALIASTSIVLECTLATRNRKDYRFIEGIQLLDYPL